MSLVHRILRKPFFGRFEVPWTWPDGTDPARWERVSIASPTGSRLAGLWGAADGAARATLVLAHPMGKAAKGFWLRQGHAELFRQAGYDVLLFDANGFGESAPASFDYPSDILAAGQWAQSRTPDAPIGLVGASFGAGWGLCAMAREGSPFRTAVLEAAFVTLPEFWQRIPVAHAALSVGRFLRPALERRFRPELEATRLRHRPPVLLVYGDADHWTPVDHGERLARAMRDSADARLLVIPGIDHTYAFRDARDAYVGAVLPFLADALANPAAPR
jgi:alpha-beta hydrolase superfamily lysophospholipase